MNSIEGTLRAVNNVSVDEGRVLVDAYGGLAVETFCTTAWIDFARFVVQRAQARACPSAIGRT